MNAEAPKIGFDRFIKAEWATTAIEVRAGHVESKDLMALLESDGLSVAAIKKTKTVLNRLWLEPRRELADFVDRGLSLYQAHARASALHWGVSIATYPFFAHVAEMVGRLTSIQGDCATAEVHRRMSERYGEREGTYRMTNMVLQSQADWGAIVRVDSNKRLVRKDHLIISDTSLAGWLLEASVRSAGKPIPTTAFGTLPILFPFSLAASASYAASENASLELMSVGGGKEMIALSSAAEQATRKRARST